MRCSLISLLSFFATLTTTAQQYLDSTSTWHFSYHTSSTLYHESEYGCERVFFDGNITLDGHVYYKMFMSSHIQYNNTALNTSYFYGGNHVYYGLMREEDRKFYIRKANMQTDSLIFDFNNYQLGNTVSTTCGYDMSIISIDSIDIGLEKRAVYHMNDPTWLYVVEGVGCVEDGFFLGCNDFDYQGTKLTGYSKQDSLIKIFNFGMSDCPAPEITPAPIIPDTTNVINDLVIYPNPVNDHCTIANLPKRALVSLYDVEGRLIGLPIADSVIDTSTLGRGVYILVIHSKDGTTRHRIIKD